MTASALQTHTDTAHVIFEIGTEELPALSLKAALDPFKQLLVDALAQARLTYDSLDVYATPRRMTCDIGGLIRQTSQQSSVVRGPAAAIAFDAEGNPTKAGLGFVRSKGATFDDVVVREEDGKSYLFVEQVIASKPASEILPEIFTKVITDIPWPRSQRWGSEHVRFARPVRWILSLMDDEILTFTFGDVTSGNTTRGHRLRADGDLVVAHADEYRSVLESHFVMLDPAARAASIKDQIATIEAQHNVVADLPAKVFDEVVNLVEWPEVMCAHFDDEFLEVPSEIITDAMLEHQRYFPLYTKDGQLTSGFIITSNGDPAYEQTIVDGNERVVRARLSDAAFFYREDLKEPLEAYVEKLEKVAFQEQLGSVGDKTKRIQANAGFFAKSAGLSSDDVQVWAERAALLCKADLVTSAVVEFTSLQGIMGGYYALAAGEHEEVARAITDHYKPRFSGDELPETTVGKLVALADKMDTICGIFAIDAAPTGSSDPFALRRAALGIINILLEMKSVPLKESLEFALKQFEHGSVQFDADETLKKIGAFFMTRMAVMAKERGIAADTVSAVSACAQESVMDPIEFFARAEALEEARAHKREVFDDLATAYARANNLTDPACGTAYSEELLCEAERDLIVQVKRVQTEVNEAIEQRDYRRSCEALATLKTPIDRFFADVHVMDADEKIKNNHFAVLNTFVAVFKNVADIGALARK